MVDLELVQLLLKDASPLLSWRLTPLQMPSQVSQVEGLDIHIMVDGHQTNFAS